MSIMLIWKSWGWTCCRRVKNNIEAQINQIVYELYGLNDENIDFYIWSYVKMVGCTPRAFPMGKPTNPTPFCDLCIFSSFVNGRLHPKGISDGQPNPTPSCNYDILLSRRVGFSRPSIRQQI